MNKIKILERIKEISHGHHISWDEKDGRDIKILHIPENKLDAIFRVKPFPLTGGKSNE